MNTVLSKLLLHLASTQDDPKEIDVALMQLQRMPRDLVLNTIRNLRRIAASPGEAELFAGREDFLDQTKARSTYDAPLLGPDIVRMLHLEANLFNE